MNFENLTARPAAAAATAGIRNRLLDESPCRIRYLFFTLLGKYRALYLT
jgi:hypothetical protein